MFEIGLNIATIALILNIGIPVVYFANFIFMVVKLQGMDKDAPFYAFIRSLVFFFFFYGLGAVYFVWYDFFYMNFTCPNPVDVLFGTIPAPPDEVVYMWMIGNLIQQVGLFTMLIQLRKRIFTSKFKQLVPIVWEIIGLTVTGICYLNFYLELVHIPLISDDPYFWIEMLFLFNFTWSISLPLTYSYIWKNAAGAMKKYAFILFLCFILYGIGWGLRSRTAVHMFIVMFEWLPLLGVPNPFTYEIIWICRAVAIIFNLSMVLYAYQKLLSEF